MMVILKRWNCPQTQYSKFNHWRSEIESIGHGGSHNNESLQVDKGDLFLSNLIVRARGRTREIRSYREQASTITPGYCW